MFMNTTITILFELDEREDDTSLRWSLLRSPLPSGERMCCAIPSLSPPHQVGGFSVFRVYFLVM